MSILVVEHLTKKFGSFTALDGVNMQLKEGEVYGFIGPNGAGKSTTIRILLGIIKATSGSAKIFGKDVWKDAVEIHKRVAYVPGDVHLWPNLTGGEVIDILLKMNGKYDKKKRDRFIELFDFDPTKKCRAYSKGNRQKVALIAAFASDADLFIFDEPTTGLDPLMETYFRQSVLEAKQEGKTVLFSSHILSEVEKLCDRVGIIRQGKIIETGSLDELRYITRSNFTVKTRETLSGLDELEGVYHIEEKDGEYSFQVDSEKIDAVIRHISQFGVVKLESSPPTLEDLFLRHYERVGKQELGDA